MTAQVRLSRYERGIVEALTESFGYTSSSARQIVVQYIGVIRKLGGYDNTLDQAERIHQAYLAGHSPEKWLERIRNLEQESRKAGNISQLEGPLVRAR